MCQQLEVLEKIRQVGEMNGYSIDLAEAQAKDYIRMNKKVSRIEKDVLSIKREQIKQGEMLARQGGQIDLIVKRMNSPVDEERKNGIVWSELKAIMKTPMGKIIVILAIGCIALAGDKILQLLGLIGG
jgi:trans-2-enoyl-CoA reductase